MDNESNSTIEVHLNNNKDDSNWTDKNKLNK